MMNTKLFKGLMVVILIEVMILTYIGVVGIVWNKKRYMTISSYSYVEYYNALEILRSEMNKSHCTMTKEEFREFIEDDLGLHFYIYKERTFKGKYVGTTDPVTRTISIDKNLEGYLYYVQFAHEAIHLKHFTGQEDYVCFELFKYLYESEELHDVGVWYAIKKLNGFQGNGEYYITNHIVNYLTNK